MITLENWAEIRRLCRAERLSARAVAERLGVSRNTVASALASDEPPSYSRATGGSALDAFEPAIRELLEKYPKMPATVIAERVGWERSSSLLRARVSDLRPLYLGVDPADRTSYDPGELVQCDLWFPETKIPLGWGQVGIPPVLVMTSGFSRLITALMIPSRCTGDLLAGMWALLLILGGVPRKLVWDNESGIGQHRRLTDPAVAFAGTLATQFLQLRPRDPEGKGVVERSNGFLETSFLPGRVFASPHDFNRQLQDWLIKANTRLVRRIGARPADRISEDRAAMLALPPVVPSVGITSRVRLPRDYYVRIDSNDYSVDPSVVGRFVDVHAGLRQVVVRCQDKVVATHQRCWARRLTITDPVHQKAAVKARADYQEKCQQRATNTAPIVQLRELPDYDVMFDTGPVDQPGAVAS